jgi:hypothetical protein
VIGDPVRGKAAIADRKILLRTLGKHPLRHRAIGAKSPHRLNNIQLVEALRTLNLSPEVIIATSGMLTKGAVIAPAGEQSALLAKVALNGMSAMTAEISPTDFAKFLCDRLTLQERRALGPYLVQVAISL